MSNQLNWNNSQHARGLPLKNLLLSLLVLLPSLSFAQAVSEVADSSNILKKDENKFAINYQFIKRSLNDTDSAQQLRNETGTILPTKLEFEQHLFGARYQINPDWALELGGSYLKSKININGFMTHSVFMGPMMGMQTIRIDVDIDSGSSGLSDTRAGVLYTPYRDSKQRVTTSLHLNAPTGNIEEIDQGRMLPYSGQLGSGTYDIIPKVAYRYSSRGWLAGSDLRYTLRTGRNDQDYHWRQKEYN